MMLTKTVFTLLTFLMIGLHAENIEQYHCEEASCEISFPTKPQHLKQRASFFQSENTYEYDVYISSLDMQTFYYLFSTKIPVKTDHALNKKALEGFLQGLLHSSQNKLLFSDLNVDTKDPTLDFFIESDHRFFMGRALIINDRFFLLAMDSDHDKIEKSFQTFVESFSLKQDVE